MPTIAERVLKPADPSIFRTAFFYVGQGDSTLHIIPDGTGSSLYVLVDINSDRTRGGIDVVHVLEDLLPKIDGKPTLDVFINTHPHNDHICGLDRLRERIRVKQVWHTGFTPSKKHDESYKQLRALIDDVVSREGKDAEFEYQGTRAKKDLGLVCVEIVSPAKHVKEEIIALTGDERDARIHEHCGVFRLGYGTQPKHVLMTGDSDKCAWQEHILGPDEYHGERISAAALSASHHGSRTFFKTNEEDPEPYTRHMELITPRWVIISSPTQAESPHDHPHDDALELYREHILDGRAENVLTLGERKECQLYDIYDSGEHVMDSDNGELVDAYGFGDDNDDGNAKKGGRENTSAAVITRVDSGHPMGARHSRTIS
jgi:competence protein ComEC